MRVELPPEDEEKARKLLSSLQLPERKRSHSLLRWAPLILIIALILAIAFVVITNWDRFSSVWHHLVRPDTGVE